MHAHFTAALQRVKGCRQQQQLVADGSAGTMPVAHGLGKGGSLCLGCFGLFDDRRDREGGFRPSETELRLEVENAMAFCTWHVGEGSLCTIHLQFPLLKNALKSKDEAIKILPTFLLFASPALLSTARPEPAGRRAERRRRTKAMISIHGMGCA